MPTATPGLNTTLASLWRPRHSRDSLHSRLIVPQHYTYLVTAYDPATKQTLRLSTANLRAARTKTSFLRESGYVDIEVKRVPMAAPPTTPKRER